MLVLANEMFDSPPAKRLLLVCDNASVHKADELKKLMDQHGIILRFLPPNMTQWLQPLDRVVCGLIKIVQRARRGRQLAANLQQWKQEQERIVGEALLNKRPHPELTPWVPPKETYYRGKRDLLYRILSLPHGFLQNQPCWRGSFSIRRPTWRSCSLRKQRAKL